MLHPTTMMKRISLTVAAVALAALASPAQDAAAVKTAVSELVARAHALEVHGKAAKRPLRRLRRGERSYLRRAVRVLEKHCARQEVATAPDAEQLKQDVTAFGKALDALTAFGPGASHVLQAAAEETESEFERSFLDKVHAAIFVKAARGEIEAYRSKSIYFLGMYEHLTPRRKLYHEAFTHLFHDPSYEARDYAGEGMQQLAAGGLEEATLASFREALADPAELSANLRVKVMCLMARLGDRGPFEHQVKGVTEMMAKEKAKEQPNPAVLRQGQAMLIGLYQDIHDYARTTDHYLAFLELTLAGSDIANAKAGQKQQLSGNFYNLACTASRSKRSSLALWAFTQALNLGYANYDGALADGDLAFLRKDARFAGVLKEWRSGKKKAGALGYDFAGLSDFLQSQ